MSESHIKGTKVGSSALLIERFYNWVVTYTYIHVYNLLFINERMHSINSNEHGKYNVVHKQLHGSFKVNRYTGVYTVYCLVRQFHK